MQWEWTKVTLIFIAVWLVVGYLWTIFFVHRILDNKRWSDTGQEPGAITLILMTITGPLMAVIIGIGALVDLVINQCSGGFIKRLFGLR